MGQIIRIAVRNLWQHKTKSLILGIFICVGVAIVLCGNGFLESSQRGMERDFRANYTGDIFVEPLVADGITLDISGATSLTAAMGEGVTTPALLDIEKIDSIIASTNGIKEKTKFITAKGILAPDNLSDDFEPADDMVMQIPYFFLFAGESQTYFNMFNKMTITEGHLPSETEDEALVDNRIREKYEKYYRVKLNMGDNVLVEGPDNGNGFVMRQAKVCGFYDQPDVNTAMTSIVYVSPKVARSFAGLTYASSFAQELPDTIDTSLSSLDEEDLFGSDDDFFGNVETDDSILANNTTDFNDILGDTSLRDKLNQTDDGAWHFIILKTESASQTQKVIDSLNRQFTDANLKCKAVNWESAGASYVKTVQGIGGIFTALVIILTIVVFIIIMNTLIVSVIERTAEIGTMRALGADKWFVRKMFFTESITISIFSSIAGVILALIAMMIVNSFHFTVTGDITKIILGGGSISLIPTFASIAKTIFLVMLGSVLANIYPVHAALKITPLRALSQDGE